MNRSDFAKRALAVIEKAKPDHACVLDEEKQIIVATDREGKASITSLTNYWAEYVHAAPDAKERVFDRIALAGRLVESEEKLDEIRVLLVPRIRPRRYFEIDVVALSAQLSSKDDPPKVPYYTPLAEHLGIGIAIDRPEHIEYLNDATKHGVSPAELDAIALTNLDRMTRSGLEKVRDGLWLGSWGDDYAVERMLLPRIFDGLDVDGDPVVFLPGAERIFVAGSNDEASLLAALALSDERMNAPRGLVTHAFVRKDGAWQLFSPKSALGRELGSRLAMHLADSYGAQKAALQEKEEAKGEDGAFVASVMAGEDGDGELVLTIASWAEGVRTLLPRTTLIAFGRGAGDVTLVPWEDVAEICGELLEPVPDLYPPRWLTKGFPDEAALGRLRERRFVGAPPSRRVTDDVAGDAAHAVPPSGEPFFEGSPDARAPRGSPLTAKSAALLAVLGLAVMAIVYAMMMR